MLIVVIFTGTRQGFPRGYHASGYVNNPELNQQLIATSGIHEGHWCMVRKPQHIYRGLLM